MPQDDQSIQDTIARTISTALSEIDCILQAHDTERNTFEELKRRMLELPFPWRAEARSPRQIPAVSVVMPTLDRARFIGEAVASVQAQTLADWELIVVDDGSSDDTAAVVATLGADSRIRYLAQPAAGQSTARNCGLAVARGEVVAYLDSDNLFYPNFLHAAVAILHLFPQADCIYGALVTEAHFEPPRSILFEAFERQRLLENNFIDLNCFAHRRSLVERFGGFDESLDRLTDWDLILRYTQNKPPFRVPVLAAQYRVVDDLRVTETRQHQPNYEAIRRKWQSTLA